MPSITIQNNGTAARVYYDENNRMHNIPPKQHRTFNMHEAMIKRCVAAEQKGDVCKVTATEVFIEDRRANRDSAPAAPTPAAEQVAKTDEAAPEDGATNPDDDPEGINTPAPDLEALQAAEQDDDAQAQDVAARDEAPPPPLRVPPASNPNLAAADRLEQGLRGGNQPRHSPGRGNRKR